MEIKRVLILTIALITASFSWAQSVVFKTLASQGTSIVQRGSNPDNYTPIKAGVKLYADDKIIITGDNSYVGLVSNDGRTLELKKGGVYDVKSLEAGLSTGETSLAQKYVQFLVNDMSKADESTGRNMKYTGSVERSIRTDAIALFIPEDTKVANQEALVKWYPREQAAAYEVVILDLFDEEVFKVRADEPRATLNFKDIGLSSDEVYKLTVRDAANASTSSSTVTLRVPGSSELQSIQKDAASLINGTPANSAIQDMVLATYFDQHELYLNAISYFEAAIAKEPNVAEYQTAYNKFLYKVGLERME